MSKGINKVILIGNLGTDPETRHTTSGDAVTNIRIATSDTWKDKQTGEQKERTEWHTVVFWRRLAEIAGEYLHKGSRVYIEGQLRTRKWQAQDGSDRYSTEIVAKEMQMLDSRSNGQQTTRSNRMQAQSPSAAAQVPPGSAAQDTDPYTQGMPADFDDDIPF